MSALTYLKNALFYLEKDHPEECFMFVKTEIKKVIPILELRGDMQGDKKWHGSPKTKNSQH